MTATIDLDTNSNNHFVPFGLNVEPLRNTQLNAVTSP